MTILDTGTKSSVDLASSAVIVDVRVSVYTGKKSDSELADKVGRAEGAQVDKTLGVVHDLFVGDADLKALLNNRSLVDAWLKRETYDWCGRMRLLPSYKLVEFARDFAVKKAAHDKLVDNFVDNLPAKISNAKFKRGTNLAHDADYPTAEKVRGSFQMTMTVMEVPTGDFRNEIATHVSEDMRQQFEQQATRYVQDIQDQQLNVIKDLLTRLSENCAVDLVTNKKGEVIQKRRRLHESTVRHAIECCERIEKFNISRDPKLEELRKQFALALEGVDPATISNSELKRATLKQNVDDILAKF